MALVVFLWAGRLNKNKDPLTVVKAFLNFCNSTRSTFIHDLSNYRIVKDVKEAY